MASTGDVSEEEVQEGLTVIGSYTDLSEVNFADNEELKAILERSDKIRILIVGKTGTGKSTLVNGLVGQRVAVEGLGLSTSGTTSSVTPYNRHIGGVMVTIFDSPGLQDGSDNEEEYLKEMKEKCCDVDLVIFAIKITDNKFVRRNPDAIAMAKMTGTFGESLWKKALVVLTCADAVEAMNLQMCSMSFSEKTKFFKKLVSDFKVAIHNTLVEDAKVPREIVERVKVIPTGHSSIKRLVDGTLWFSNFWLESLTSIPSPEARAAMIKLNARRFHSGESVEENDFLRQLEDQPIIISSKKSDIKKLTLTLGSIAGSGFLGACIGAVGLVGGPVGLLGIPVGFYFGIVIGALLSAMREKSK